MSGGHRTLSAGWGPDGGRTVGDRARRPPGLRRRRSRRQRRERALRSGPRDDSAAQERPSRRKRRHAGRRGPACVVSERRDRRGPVPRRRRSRGQADREHPSGHVGWERLVKRGRRLPVADLEGPGPSRTPPEGHPSTKWPPGTTRGSNGFRPGGEARTTRSASLQTAPGARPRRQPRSTCRGTPAWRSRVGHDDGER